MKGDFTRLTPAGRKRFARVMMQQGRVQLDQDWNEQMEILARRWELQTRDMIGHSGVPQDTPGLGVTYDAGAGRLLLSPGRLYVDGLLCEAFPDDGAPLSLGSQPCVPAGAAGPALAPPAAGTDRTDLIYVRTWERHVSAVEDPSLLEPALGGADTTTRTQTAWQVLSMPAPLNAAPDSEIPGWQELTGRPTGTLSARTAGPTMTDTSYLPDGGGYRGLENRLYRVEVHTGGDMAHARFKWSRDNGSVASRVDADAIHGSLVTVSSLGRDAFTGFGPGQWVEVLDDEHEFRDGCGLLARVTGVREADRTLELDRDVSACDGTNARVRRWDMVTEGPEGALAMTGDWQELELGLQVRFWPGTYRPGDYWTFAARAATATIDPVGSEEAGAAPQGVAYRYYKLALAHWRWLAGSTPADPPVLTCRVDDLRYHFPALATPPKKEILQASVFVAPGENFTLRLQQAIAALPDGGSITLTAGFFTLDQPLVLENRKRIAIRGITGATCLLYDAAEETLPALIIQNCAEVELEGLSLYGRNARTLIRAEETQGLRLTDCRLTNFSTEGVAIWTNSVLSGLSLEKCTVHAAVGIVSTGSSLQSASFLRSTLRCLRIGITARAINGLTMTDSTIAPITAAMLTIDSLTADQIRTAEATPLPSLSEKDLPAGIIVAWEGTNWTLTQTRIVAGLAIFAVKLRYADLRDCRIYGFRGLVTLNSMVCSVTNSQFYCARGNSVAAFGQSLEWQLESSKLTGGPVALRFGPIEREVLWLGALADVANQPADAYLLPADHITSGAAPTGVPALPTSDWLATALTPITDQLNYELSTAASRPGRADVVRIRHSLLSAVVFSDGCPVTRVEITENQFTTVPTYNVELRGTPEDESRQVLISQNLFWTEGVAVSVDVPGAVVAGNQIRSRLLNADFWPAADALAKSANPEAQAIGAALKKGGEPFRTLLRTKAAQLDEGADLGDLAADFTAAAAAYVRGGRAKELALRFAAEYQTANSAARTLLLWADISTVASRRPVIRSGRTATIVDNDLEGDTSIGVAILLDATQGPAGTLPIEGAVVRSNRLRGGGGHGIVGLAPLRRSTVADNTVENMGGIIVDEFTGGTLTGNRVTLAPAEIIHWGTRIAALYVEKPAGQVLISGNQLTAGNYCALRLGDSGSASLIVTGNTFSGTRRHAVHLVKLGDATSTVVFAQNQIQYDSPYADPAVSLKASRASLTGNVWMEANEARPLLLEAETWTVVGNVSTRELPDGSTPQKQGRHNAYSVLTYPNDPQVSMTAPLDKETVTSAVTIRVSARDRNADEGSGVDAVTVYRTGPDGRVAMTPTVNPQNEEEWLLVWDPIASNAPYGEYQFSASAHSSVRDVTQTSAAVTVTVAEKYPADPEVAITGPTITTFDPGVITIIGTARDRNAGGDTAGIDHVSLYLDGVEETGEYLGDARLDAAGYWSFEWTTGEKVSRHSICAVAHSRRAGGKATSPSLWLYINPVYSEDPYVTINSPAYSGLDYTGDIEVIGHAYDRNSSTQPGVTVTILTQQSTNPPVERGTAVFQPDGFWTYTLNTADLVGPTKIIASAWSSVQNLGRTFERTVNITYPSDPQIGVTNVYTSGYGGGWETSSLEGDQQAASLAAGDGDTSGGIVREGAALPEETIVFEGWAYDRNATEGHGIQQVHIMPYGENVIGSVIPILVSPIAEHAGHRYENCGWRFECKRSLLPAYDTWAYIRIQAVSAVDETKRIDIDIPWTGSPGSGQTM